jgi:HEPN domain-containing protein
VTKKPPGRTQTCDRADAQRRLQQANWFLEAARVFQEEDTPAAASVAATNAVMAAIAASDAACCAALQYRPRGDDHFEAVRHLAFISPGGRAASNALKRALDLKTQSQYGLVSVSPSGRDGVIRQAEKLIEFAEAVLAR